MIFFLIGSRLPYLAYTPDKGAIGNALNNCQTRLKHVRNSVSIATCLPLNRLPSIWLGFWAHNVLDHLPGCPKQSGPEVIKCFSCSTIVAIFNIY